MKSPLATATVEQCPTQVRKVLALVDALEIADATERPIIESKLFTAYHAITLEGK